MTKTQKAITLAYERGYRVTDDGKLIGAKGRIINAKAYGEQRYPVFTLNRVTFTNSGKKAIRVHQFAAYCFFGEKMFEDGIIVRHLNDDPLDFSKANIALGSDRDNKADIPKRKRSEMTARKLSYEQVKLIRELYSEGKGYKYLSEMFGVKYATVWDIVNLRSWSIEEAR